MRTTRELSRVYTAAQRRCDDVDTVDDAHPHHSPIAVRRAELGTPPFAPVGPCGMTRETDTHREEEYWRVS